VKLPKPNRIKIGDWVRVRKVGINGVYQVKNYNEDGTLIVEQDDGGYKHRMKVNIEDIVK
jgi:hypothetical protein